MEPLSDQLSDDAARSTASTQRGVRPSAPFMREGWLRKRGAKNQAWKWRWCVIDGPDLYYYRGNVTAWAADLRGTIPLGGASIAVDFEVNREVHIATPSREYILELPYDTPEQQKWVAAIFHASRRQLSQLDQTGSLHKQEAPAAAAAKPGFLSMRMARKAASTGDIVDASLPSAQQLQRRSSSGFLPRASPSLAIAAAKVEQDQERERRSSSDREEWRSSSERERRSSSGIIPRCASPRLAAAVAEVERDHDRPEDDQPAAPAVAPPPSLARDAEKESESNEGPRAKLWRAPPEEKVPKTPTGAPSPLCGMQVIGAKRGTTAKPVVLKLCDVKLDLETGAVTQAKVATTGDASAGAEEMRSFRMQKWLACLPRDRVSGRAACAGLSVAAVAGTCLVVLML